MSDIFISYKREDEVRVARLVQALQKSGLDPWWDRGLPSGESWRENIQNALTAAKVVIVAWTHESVGPAGDFVRDEASQAKARGMLVPVLLENVRPPLGFGEVQAINLARWNGSPRDPDFLDLVAALRAKLEGRAAPPARGPANRLFRRVFYGGVLSAVGAGIVAFGMNALSMQDQVCRVSFFQPGMSDACGALNLGNAPKREERLAWAERPEGSCEALRAHVERFPNGAYRSQAADLIAAARTERATDYSAAPREARGYVRQSERPFASEALAQADAQARAQADATATLCAPRNAFERLAAADVTPGQSDCRQSPSGGYVCALDFVAQCRIEERALVERCS